MKGILVLLCLLSLVAVSCSYIGLGGDDETVEATEEAVLNSLFMSETLVGRDGNTRHGLPVEEIAAWVRKTTESDCTRMP